VVWLKGRVTSPPFSSAARKETGVLIDMLQKGASLSMPSSRPMPGIGASCHELRVRDVDHDWRIVYAIERDAILVLDVSARGPRRRLGA
jgi:phage-related protein